MGRPASVNVSPYRPGSLLVLRNFVDPQYLSVRSRKRYSVVIFGKTLINVPLFRNGGNIFCSQFLFSFGEDDRDRSI